MRQILSLLIALTSFLAFSSDHIDGPATMKHKVGDLVDLYAFKNEKNPEKLVLILNTYPLVGKAGHFSEKISYRILLKEVKKVRSGFEVSDEMVSLFCHFKTPWSHSKHVVNCHTNKKGYASAKYNEDNSKNDDDDFKLFAGKRADPFFFNGKWATSVSTKGIIPPAKDDNIMSKMNVLSLVVEIDINKLFEDGENKMIAISAESVTRGEDGKLKVLDRVGRPEITNVSLVAHENNKDLRDLFNNERSFFMKKENRELYVERLDQNIQYYDKLDKSENWTTEEREKLVNILVDDFLVIDMSKPCQKESFLSIEKSMLKGEEHSGCGGRLLEDDIMDTLFTLYINADKDKRIEDGVNKPYKQVSKSFPYLAEPVTGFGAWSKLQLAKTILYFKNLF